MAKITGVYSDKKRGIWRWQFEERGTIYSGRGFETQREAADALALKK